MRPIIKVENLSKLYRIGTRGPAYRTLRETLAGAFRAPLARLRHNGQADSETIWALKDVSFEVYPGEVIGIIGRNGAGKSTLLKILSRITEPTTGRVELYGKVGSLLEVGTGFHPELTGRENVYLNGAILGMTRREIDKKFDEIVDFAEIEKFIDTPVKHYSSGMYMRLAFAVAAHLDPEIVIIDEILAVGDANFQRKCLDRISKISQEGKTILFVGHNMDAMLSMCKRSMLLDRGSIIVEGSPHLVAHRYYQHMGAQKGILTDRYWSAENSPGDNLVRLRRVRLRNQDGDTLLKAQIDQPLGVEMTYEVLESGHVLVPNYHFFNEFDVYMFVVHDTDPNWRGRPKRVGRYITTLWVPANFLSEGWVRIGVAVSSYKVGKPLVHFYETDALSFEVIDTYSSAGARGDYMGPVPGIIRPKLNCTTLHEV